MNIGNVSMNLSESLQPAPPGLYFGEVIRTWCGGIEVATLYLSLFVLLAAWTQWQVNPIIKKKFGEKISGYCYTITDNSIFFGSAWIVAIFWYKKQIPLWIIISFIIIIVVTIIYKIMLWFNKKEKEMHNNEKNARKHNREH